MNYYSTRDRDNTCTGTEAILQGLARDGGLFVPASVPKLSETALAELFTGSYGDIAAAVLGLFLPEIDATTLRSYINAAYSEQKWGGEPAPIAKLGEQDYMLELWHGPTCAFKDIALQLLPHLLTHSIGVHRPGDNAAILVATSGDTGKAALEGFSDIPNTRIQVFYPNDGVSPLQALQMKTQQGSNLSVVGVDGNFDDAQTGVKAIFSDAALRTAAEKQGVFLSSANSINWGRLVPQIVYYFAAYAALCQNEEIKPGDTINIAVPTGNFGNILAAYYAKVMGLAVGQLICASNENDVLTEFLQTGCYNSQRGFFTTISPSMDILISSNLERLLFALSGDDDAQIVAMYQALRESGSFIADDRIATKLREQFFAASADEEETLRQISDTFSRYGYTVDPHTAVGLAAVEAWRAQGGQGPVIVAATASPYKFPRSVLRALTGDAPEDEFLACRELSALTGTDIPKAITDLEYSAPRCNQSCTPGEMKAVASAFILGNS